MDSIVKSSRRSAEKRTLKREGFLVLGMHRSGTSSMTGTLVKLGVKAPKTPLGAGPGNERGHWEPLPIVVFHDELLASAGSRWDDWRPFREDWYETPVAAEFKARAKALLKDEFGDAPAFVLKDPRICRFPRFWLDIFAEEGIVPKILLPLRSPLEAAHSLRTRDAFPLRKGLLIWLRHVLDAEAATRDLPRSVVEWNVFLDDWRAAVARMESELNTRWPALTDFSAAEVERFLSRDLKHERVPDSELVRHPELHAWVLEAYEALRELAQEPGSTSARTALDRVRSRFDDACRLFGGALAEMEVAHAELTAALQAEREAQAAREAALQALREERDAKAAEVERLGALVETMRSSAEQVEAALRAEMEAALDNERQARAAEAAARDAAIHALQAERDAKAEEVVRLTELIETTLAETNQTEALLRQEYEAVLDSERQARAAEAAAHTEALAALAAERDAKAKEVERLTQLIETTRASAEQAQAALRAEFEAVLDSERQARAAEVAAHAQALQALTAANEELTALRAELKRALGNERLLPETFASEQRTYAAETSRLAQLVDAAQNALKEAHTKLRSQESREQSLKHEFNMLQKKHELVLASRRWRFASKIADKYTDLLRIQTRLKTILLQIYHYTGERYQSKIIKASGMFDEEYYLGNYPDVAQSKLDPIIHYLRFGAAEGRNPSNEFSTSFYRARNPDVVQAGVNPLVHYIRFGRQEGRPVAAPSSTKTSDLDKTLSSGPWQIQDDELQHVSIIIPVFNGASHLERLLPSLLANTHRDVEILIFDDGSTDPAVPSMLADFASCRKNVRLHRSETNSGFVKTVNQAAALARQHFIILNTDTVVPPRWVERLVAPIFHQPNVASATPFSNAATIYSFPNPPGDNALLPGCDVDQIDQAFAEIEACDWPSELAAPTGVGFCMAINGDVWSAIGGFDEDAFGKGYGEENDWCQRAIAHGFSNILVPNLFVFHNHGGSFSTEEKRRLVAINLAKLNERWPNYLPSVYDHIGRDPWHEVRALAFLKICLALEPVIIFDHALGGGANAYRSRLMEQVVNGGRPAVLITYAVGAAEYHATAAYAEFTSTVKFSTFDRIATLLMSSQGAEIVYNNAVSWPDPIALADFIFTLRTGARSGRLRVLFHDFFPVCPSYTLLNASDKFCGVPAEIQACQRCVARNRHAPLIADVELWRRAWGRVLEAADEIVCFSESSKAIVNRAYPAMAARVTVRLHDPLTKFERLPQLRASPILNLGVIGGINFAKGAAVVRELCVYLEQSCSSARVTVIGEIDPIEHRPSPNLHVHGRYTPNELPYLIEHYGINVALVPSIWPETFSYVTQELIDLRVPTICFDIGAPAERVARYSRGVVLKKIEPAEIVSAALKLAASLDSERSGEAKA